VVRRLLGEAAQLETDAPATVQMEIRGQDDPRRLALHVVNNTGDGVFPLGAIVPAGKASVSLRCDRPKRVWSTGGGELPWSWKGGRLHLELDVSTQYEIVAIEG
jgi:hypothetical protein